MADRTRMRGLPTLVLLAFPMVSAAIPIVVKGNLISASLGAVYRNPFDDKGAMLKLLDWGVGTKIGPRFGFGLGASVGCFNTHVQEPIETPPFFLATEVYAFAAPSLREQPHAPVVFGHFALDLWDTPKNSRFGVGINSTFWVLNPEIEIDWLREYPNQYYAKTTDYLAVRLRLGLGGWYEFGR